ncbi:hypothetical protein A6X20_16675 [Bradyrhizobium elkanii]|nr:hypothetical protein [Bradyrhizobium elkanii]ODM75060.1 hypothetical protein A6452_39090 [Bradyrhizobium elkanii]ODM82755.1 hypothetical protein A6X20_16675 [Bradyrhizobium elkanii]
MVVTWKDLVAAIENNPELKNMLAEPPVFDEGEQKEKAEIERLFNFIGMYVVVFQDVRSFPTRWQISMSARPSADRSAVVSGSLLTKLTRRGVRPVRSLGQRQRDGSRRVDRSDPALGVFCLTA